VLVVEVDLVYPKPLERALARLADVGPVAPDAVKRAVGAANDAKLGADEDLVTLCLERVGEQLLVLACAVHIPKKRCRSATSKREAGPRISPISVQEPMKLLPPWDVRRVDKVDASIDRGLDRLETLVLVGGACRWGGGSSAWRPAVPDAGQSRAP
jgi:hypothetical protein